MGFFAPKISKSELEYVRATLKQVNDSARLINTTTNPEVFFKRLNFTLDLLLHLQKYGKYKIFKAGKPSQDYYRIICNMEATVDDFIDHVLEVNRKKVLSLRTSTAKKRNYENCIIGLNSAFDCTHTFWEGDK